MRTQDQGGGVRAAEENLVPLPPESAEVPEGEERRHLRAVPAQSAAPDPEVTEPVDTGAPAPQIQRDAWTWALEHRREDGTLPSGRVIAERFGRKARWGRLVKQRGERGEIPVAA